MQVFQFINIFVQKRKLYIEKKRFEIELCELYSSFEIDSTVSLTEKKNKISGGPNRKFVCFNKERFNPINFGIDYHKDSYDGAACFRYLNRMWHFSLYNDNGLVDCSVIAKGLGGGGHKGAAGFIIKDINKFLNK